MVTDKASQSLNNLGLVAQYEAIYDEAERLHNASLATKREIGDRPGEFQSLNNLGIIADVRGDYDEAERFIMCEFGNQTGNW